MAKERPHRRLRRASILVVCAACRLAPGGAGEASEPLPAAPEGGVGVAHPADGSVLPPELDSFLREGATRQSTGDPDAAERSLRGGLELEPDHPALRAALGSTLQQSGRTDEAVAEYRRALEASPDDARTHAQLARALLEVGDLRGAGTHFTRSLALEPSCEVYADLGLLQDLLGREDLARESYEKGIALDATCPAPRLSLAAMLLEDGGYQEAALHYRKALEGKPTAKAHSGLGFALNQLGRLEEAAAEHDAAVALDPSLAVVHRNRALTQARLGAYAEAVLSYRRAVAIEPRVSTYYSLAGVLRAADRRDEAEEAYRRGRELSRSKPRNEAPPRVPGSPHGTGLPER